MKEQSSELVSLLMKELHGHEEMSVYVRGETSDFVRFNRGLIRQPGSVRQCFMDFSLIDGGRSASATVSMAFDGEDLVRLRSVLGELREIVSTVQPDPYLNTFVSDLCDERVHAADMPDAKAMVDTILSTVSGTDFVGIFASGTVARGFFSSHGQAQWFERPSFNLDYSLYASGDKASKGAYAGFSFDASVLTQKIEKGMREVEILKRPVKPLQPGHVRAYLAPAAVAELMGILSWGGFGLAAKETQESVFRKLQSGEAELSRLLSLRENTTEGASAHFQSTGFQKPDEISMIAEGRWGSPLVSPRSAKEYGQQTNGANGGEAPESLDMATGNLAEANVLKELGDGLYINNLWYLNFSDRPAGRITGMTRFATLLVENSEVIAPTSVMRFDDTIYRILGRSLLSVGDSASWILDPSTYTERRCDAMRVPGILIEDLELTL